VFCSLGHEHAYAIKDWLRGNKNINWLSPKITNSCIRKAQPSEHPDSGKGWENVHLIDTIDAQIFASAPQTCHAYEVQLTLYNSNEYWMEIQDKQVKLTAAKWFASIKVW
jgi:hypothetical protein